MIRGVTDYTNAWCLRHPALNSNGKRNKLIGRGTFACVYESNRPNAVLKVTTDYYAYAAHTDRVAALTGKWFPRVYRDYGQIGHLTREQPVYMVEIERLKPLGGHGQYVPKNIVSRVLDFINMMGGPDLIETDFHRQNVMKRMGTGDMVLADPVCDVKQIRDRFNAIREYWNR